MVSDGVESVAAALCIPECDGFVVECRPGLDEAEIPEALCAGGEEEWVVGFGRRKAVDVERAKDHIFGAERLAHVPWAGR